MLQTEFLPLALVQEESPRSKPRTVQDGPTQMFKYSSGAGPPKVEEIDERDEMTRTNCKVKF